MTMVLLVAATGLIASLQMMHIRAGVLTSHGADVLCPALLYIVTRRNQTLLKRVWPKRPSAELAATLVLGASYVWEFCQLHDLRGTILFFTRGTFDPLDLLAYTFGVALSFLPDRFSHRASVKDFYLPR